jgi:hypothetical protein
MPQAFPVADSARLLWRVESKARRKSPSWALVTRSVILLKARRKPPFWASLTRSVILNVFQ